MRTLLLGWACAAAVFGADLTGTWIAERTMPNGMKMETVYKLKQNGTELTGTMTMMMGDMPIRSGKVEGDKITFEIVMDFFGEERKITTTGVIKGPDEIELQGGGMPRPPGGGPGGPGFGPGGPGAGPGGPRPPMGPLVARRLTPELEKARAEEAAKRPRPALPALKELPDNGLVRTPPMGWNSYNAFRTKIDDKTVREMADMLVESGMAKAGYIYLNIDDGWQGKRDEKGVLQPNAGFPDMKALSDYVHSKGLKLGIYSSPGPRTCGGFEGSYLHEEQDAKTWAAWGFDYLKYDWCSAQQVYAASEMRAVYQKMAEALRATGRPIVYSICQYGREKVHEWGPLAGGNLWRTTFDIRDTWASMTGIGFRQAGLEKFAGPGRWNDPDMLEVGNGGMTQEEYRTHMTLWSVLAAPLLAGNDLRKMTPETKEILMHPEVIAINQDALGKQGYRVAQNGEQEIWVKPLAKGALVVALFNRGAAAAEMSVAWRDVEVEGAPKVRDVWARKDLGRVREQFVASVPPHGAVLLRLEK